MKIAILGSGNGGVAAAADWSLAGHQVRLFDFKQFSANIDAINKKGGIEVKGAIQGFAKLAYAGHDIEKTLDGAEFILVIGPAYSSEAFGKACKSYLKKEQMVCICPSSCGGAIVFKNAVGLNIEDENYIISETSTLPYACRVTGLAEVTIYHKLTGGLYVAAMPSKYLEKVYDVFKLVYPGSEPVKSIFMTMMQTGNTIIHPSVTLLNASRIESTKGDFLFYEEGATPAAGRLMEALDKEKIALSDKLEAGLIPDVKVKIYQGYNQIEDYETGYSTAEGFKGIKAQNQLDHRYLNEDVGYGLVFMSELAKQVGVETPVMDAMILIASIITKRDYRKEAARTMKTLGLEKYTLDELKNIFN
ncbi:NAD/NADP-dependent octopine/nopaline dehydrogenase family protein [Crassaminicella profunda]|uniref:NAD/NADP-dependent octopine/nopaline dehydrogenase family protein n=1 Tax=Crassaminicella profunda TaxID=1286698 RepID=UPI001CA746BF|nr:NAD/NADP-dependent octopine/nopaline dehydrogenase family protein [Crassaminicella profunda]QZY56516.1 NAD/NADP octopine/nopaline dehydrogenase family protein [Crassaminicella profunda]